MTNLEVTKPSVLMPAILAALLLGGCAQTPPKNGQTLAEQAAQYGVTPDLLVKADQAGYFPQSHEGKTYFCTQQSQTFSYVARAQCLEPAQMAARLQLSGQQLSDLQQRVLAAPTPRSN